MARYDRLAGYVFSLCIVVTLILVIGSQVSTTKFLAITSLIAFIVAAVAASIYFWDYLYKKLITSVFGKKYIDNAIEGYFYPVSKSRFDKWHILKKALPHYTYVDLFQSVETFVSEYKQLKGKLHVIESSHGEPLSQILSKQFYHPGANKISNVSRLAYKTSHKEEVFLCNESFWLIKSPDKSHNIIIRLKYDDYKGKADIEVASDKEQHAQETIDKIIDNARAHSVYRNQFIELQFQNEIRDNYGDVETPARVNLEFKSDAPVEDDDIILSNEISQLLDRVVIDFYKRREQLSALNLPTKRGILMYGPPGTGKTHCCKYLAGKLSETTKVIAAGNSLAHIRDICNVAKMLQPALIILEDIDLMFSDRETNSYQTILGEFMDQLDGFNDAEHVMFIMTTNSLHRVEAAIKDRPGRVSQCIYMGAPAADLRHLYLERLCDAYNITGLDMDVLTDMTHDTSQAYLKELVIRAVQIATLDAKHVLEPVDVVLQNSHFEQAHNEMIKHGGEVGKKIIGFIQHD